MHDEPRQRRGRSGWADFADLLRLVLDRPGTTAELAESFGIRADNLRESLRLLRDMGLVLVTSWRPVRGGGGFTPVWGMSGPPAPHPLGIEPRPAPHAMTDLTSFCMLMRVLKGENSTVDELAMDTGLNIAAIRRLMPHLLHVAQLVYVEDWRVHPNPAGGGAPVAAYRWGPGRRSKRRPIPQAEREAWARRLSVARLRKQQAQLLFMFAGRAWPTDRTTSTNGREETTE